jgi:shikimate kinase/3-dehydroquinate synthase
MVVMARLMKPTRIPVRAPNAQYPIIVGSGLLQTLPDLLAERKLTGRVAIVTNETLAPLYGKALAAQFDGASLIVLPDGEQYKTLNTIRQLYGFFVEADLDRKAIVIALGGGVIGDIAGFAAATYLRGVPFVQVPTSLLAMVDSSIGGKVGVDLPQGKNLVGAFKQPEMVVVDPAVLHSLPDVEWRCGIAEAVKAGLIRDPSLLDPAIYQRDAADNDASFIKQAIAIKVSVVQEDPYENNIRAYLNLGHTFGHALERASNYTWRHGEAVALGLLAAARLSQVHGLCDTTLPFQVEQMLRALNLPVRYSGYTAAEVRAAMGTDKKRQNSQIRFVLLRAPGDPVLCSDVPEQKILNVLDSLRE